MSGFTKNEFEGVLVDVRKAYRFLFLYQKRILDLIQYIGDSMDFRFVGGFNWFTPNPQIGTKAKLTNSAWEWLNMYFYEFNFGEKNINNNSIKFSVIIESDTGYFDSMINYENINSYSPVQKSETKLIFLVGKNIWWDPDYKELFDDDNLAIYKAHEYELIRKNEIGTLLIKCFPLSRFINSEETNRCLKEWTEFLIKNDINEIIQI